ncbi:mannose-1-phosphate guanylyltransferase/mannose-6-phosphate isomerase [Amylibacter sp.]|nr:mannose-1-phosphate guanylyltransferase/mannose-6-phosphate isomerase [Amylibacter sp.]MDC1455700.1 mannose-1-phosphate guanylyltransferase/mannose-6-phosphate isomerase [Amylibacter sp.]
MQQITPIILCGGSGSRLWPLSRKSYPKQFVPLVGNKTLFQNSATRLTGPKFKDPIIVTNSDYRFIVTEQLQEIGIDPGAILIEPEGRNTAPAILAAALFEYQENPDAVLVVAPSDHIINDVNAFQLAIDEAYKVAQDGQLVTFGIKPTHPETGFGYLELSKISTAKAVPLKAFVEKPDLTNAKKMFQSENFLWNSGIFLFQARDIIEAFKKYSPSDLDAVNLSIKNSINDLGFFRLNLTDWIKTKNISIDYAIMEKSDNLSVVPFSAGWSDLGGWDAVWRENVSNANGVNTSNNATAIDCENSLIRSEDDSIEVVGIGLKNIITVAMKDAVLVADMSKSQDVKKAVDLLKQKHASQATHFPKDHRPWGWFESLTINEKFHVKKIHVHPGASLSLQSHKYRAEHWIVVSGEAEVTIDKEVKLISANQSVYIPLGAVHRMRNPGKIPIELIEVQTGTYFGEDDIFRYDDVYSRGQGPKG